MYIAIGFYSGVGPIITIPAGWNLVFAGNRNGCALSIYEKTAGGSEPSSYAFTASGTDYISAVFAEVSSFDASYSVNKFTPTYAFPSATQLAGSPTPSVLGCLALAFFTTDEGTSSRTGASTVDSGWTLDQSAIPLYHAIEMAHKTATTTDIITAIGVTFTYTGIGTDAVAVLMLIAPTIPLQKLASVSSITGISTLIL